MKKLSCFFLISLHAAVDFDISMQLNQHTFQLLDSIQDLLPLARRLYIMYHPEKVIKRSRLVIPRIMHHIWFGKPLSQEDKQLRSTWEQMHPDWRFVLWTDRHENDPRGLVVRSWQELHTMLEQTHERYLVVDVADLEFDNRSFFDSSRNYGEKSDIIKYEIVYRLGGVYVDCDFECLKPLDDLHYFYDFYTGIQPLDTNYAQLGAAIFGAKLGHPILKCAVETVDRDRGYTQIVMRTGPIHFTRAFIAGADKENNIDIALPASYFYPCGYTQKGEARENWLCPESYAVHHWAGSWLMPDAFAR